MMRSLLFIMALLTSASAFAKHSVHDCKLYVYPVDAYGHVATQPLVSPKQVASVRYGGIDPFTGMGIWRIALTPQGAVANSRYTKSHLGGKVAAFCGKVAVGQFAIQGTSSGSFMISSNELGP